MKNLWPFGRCPPICWVVSTESPALQIFRCEDVITFEFQLAPIPRPGVASPIFWGDGSEKGKINLKSTTVHLYNIVTQLSILYLYIVLSDNQEIPRIYEIFEWFLSRSQLSRKGESFFVGKWVKCCSECPFFTWFWDLFCWEDSKLPGNGMRFWDLPQHCWWYHSFSPTLFTGTHCYWVIPKG